MLLVKFLACRTTISKASAKENEKKLLRDDELGSREDNFITPCRCKGWSHPAPPTPGQTPADSHACCNASASAVFRGNTPFKHKLHFKMEKTHDLVNISAFKENIDSRQGLDCNFFLSPFHIDLKLTGILSGDLI